MKPLRLTLKGFTGIRDGLGRDELQLDLQALAGDAALVALVGPNGSGKSTVIDNLQPYRLMPSRAGSLSPAGFSFYEQLCAPQACKELEWQHDGQRWRSLLLWRSNGSTRRGEAYLQQWRDGQWAPAALPDGSRSDGRAETYDRCIEALLGPPEAYFTSVFCAQQRRPLSAWRPGEVKGLMAELLQLERVRAHGERAGRVAGGLRTALAQRREQQRSRATRLAERAALAQQLRDAAAAVRQRQAEQAEREREQAQAQERLAALQAEQAAQAVHELRRAELGQQRDERLRRAAQLQARLHGLRTDQQQLQQRLETQRRAHATAAHAEQAALRQELAQAQALLAQRSDIEAAVAQLPRLAQQDEAARAALATARERQQAHRQAQQQWELARQRLAALQREAGAATLQCEQLRRRHALAERVPCHGLALAGRCELLADAHAAQALQPAAALELARLHEQAQQVQQQVAMLERQAGALADSDTRVQQAQASCEAAQSARMAAAGRAAQQPALAQAGVRIERLQQALRDSEQRLQQRLRELGHAVEAAGRQSASELDAVQREMQALADERVALERQLAALPAPCSSQPLRAAQVALQAAAQRLAQARAAQLAAVAQQAQLAGRADELEATLRALPDRSDGIAALEQELVHWTLLAQALGADGVIALCIDDAGPALAQLANELLLACYGPRFTLSIETQVATAKGELREGFGVVAHDASSSQAKPLAAMSGGEKVWINEALTRAIALFVARHSGRRYQALFCDEADGALDAQRKRMFMAMKREALRLGGYEQEYFVTQSPELWCLADRQIDLRALARGPAGT